MNTKKQKEVSRNTIPVFILNGIIALVAFAIYANTLNHGFVLDDLAVIENNTLVKQGIEGISELFTTFYWKGFWDSNSGLYRPVSLIMFAIEYNLSPENPIIHHFMNVLFYAISSCMLFNVLRRCFNNINPLFFLFSTLIFVAHPINTEVVANIKSRDEIMALLFSLLCLHYLLKETTKNKVKTMLFSSLFFLLALLSKEGAIAFLPIIFLIEYVKGVKILEIIKGRIFLILTFAFWFAWHQYIIYFKSPAIVGYTFNDNSLLASSHMIDQKATAFGIFARYIFKSIYPYQLSYDYSFNQIPIINFFSPLALVGIILFMGIIVLGYKSLKKNPLLSIAFAFMLFPLMLTSNIFLIIGATMADRFLYVPVIGSSILLCWLVFKAVKLNVSDTFSMVKPLYILLPLFLVYSMKTIARNKDWKNNFTLFSKDVKTVPESARAHYNYARALKNFKDDKSKLIMLKEYEKCLEIDPNYFDAWVNYGVIFANQKDYTSALKMYREAFKLNPNNTVLNGNIGEAFFRINQPDSTIIYLERAHKFGNKKSESYDILGTAWFQKGIYTKACLAFEEGLKIDPNSWSLYLNYGNALVLSNRDSEGISALKKSYQLNENNSQTLYYIALTYNKLGDTLNANKYYRIFQENKP
jgi:cytochrome c-type biogenesis protein CcmH/NrfG